MKFKQIHRLLILTFVLCFKIIRGDNSEANKWHIFRGFLFYIEFEQKYTELDAIQYCESIGMANFVYFYTEFGEYLQSFYGNFPPLRVTHFGRCESYGGSHVMHGWMKNQAQYLKNGCSKKFGFVCMRDISYGEIQFKNGTQLSINRDDVIKYCDPQAEHAFDQQNCMIIFRP